MSLKACACIIFCDFRVNTQHECVALHMPASASKAAQNSWARNQDYYCMLWTAVLLLLLWKRNGSMTENEDLDPHPAVIPQPGSFKLAYLWIVLC